MLKKPRVFDCFTYFNEKDILQLRIRLLKDVVDYFVVVESNMTFTGQVKNFNFDASEFDLPHERFIFVKVTDMPAHTNSAWDCEYHQRNSILQGLTDADPRDIIHVSDVDEIPNPNAILNFKPSWPIARLRQNMFYYAWNNLLVDRKTKQPVPWTAAKITTFRSLRKLWGSPQNLRMYTLQHRSTFNRLYTRLFSRTINDGGWHWSYIMSAQNIAKKIRSFSHTEYAGEQFSSEENVEQRMKKCVDPFDRADFELITKDPKELFPKYVHDILEADFPSFLNRSYGNS